MKIVPGGYITHGGRFTPGAPPETLADVAADAIEILGAQIEEWDSNHPDEPDEVLTDLRNRFVAALGRAA